MLSDCLVSPIACLHAASYVLAWPFQLANQANERNCPQYKGLACRRWPLPRSSLARRRNLKSGSHVALGVEIPRSVACSDQHDIDRRDFAKYKVTIVVTVYRHSLGQNTLTMHVRPSTVMDKRS